MKASLILYIGTEAADLDGLPNNSPARVLETSHG
jgi:hypothetical protein